MNEFDQHAKRFLKVKYYLRYADDIFMILDGKNAAKEVLSRSKAFIKERLLMDFAQGKCYTSSLKQAAIVGLGYKIYI